MSRTRIEMGVVMLGFSITLLLNAQGFPQGLPESSAQQLQISADEAQSHQPNQFGEKKDLQKPQPVIPPNNDAEMVIKPDVPTNPEAVITPPVVDPEMAVDPTTRQPMTDEKLEELTPEELEENARGEK
ncbi:MAG TPA: hypothetical protein PKM72_02380 [Nitrospirales bacterium]|nr:hypothetical protein [Nitrospirales bacterium]